MQSYLIGENKVTKVFFSVATLGCRINTLWGVLKEQHLLHGGTIKGIFYSYWIEAFNEYS